MASDRLKLLPVRHGSNMWSLALEENNDFRCQGGQTGIEYAAEIMFDPRVIVGIKVYPSGEIALIEGKATVKLTR